MLDLADVPPPAPGTHYEVWVLRESSGGAMEAVGAFTPDGSKVRLKLGLPGSGDYEAVDVSVEPDGGSASHSGHEPRRGTVRAFVVVRQHILQPHEARRAHQLVRGVLQPDLATASGPRAAAARARRRSPHRGRRRHVAEGDRTPGRRVSPHTLSQSPGRSSCAIGPRMAKAIARRGRGHLDNDRPTAEELICAATDELGCPAGLIPRDECPTDAPKGQRGQ